MTKKNFDQKVKRTKKLHKAIKINLKRRTIIVDDKLVYNKESSYSKLDRTKYNRCL